MTHIKTATEIIAQAAATTPPMAVVENPTVVAAVKTKMRELGYVDGGPVDEGIGEKFKDEILTVRRREELPLTPTIDAEFLATLETAQPKVLPAEQVTATAPEIAPKVEAMKQTRWAKFWAKITAIPSIAVAALIAVAERFDDAVQYLSPLKGFVENIPGWAWLGGAGIVAALIAYNMGKAESAMTDGYQRGTVKNDNIEAKAAEIEADKESA